MSGENTKKKIEDAVRRELDGTGYAISSLEPLTGGTANFIYHARLQKPLPDGSADVVLKHGEAYVAQHPDFKLQMVRCVRDRISQTNSKGSFADAYSMVRILKRRACDYSPISPPWHRPCSKSELQSFIISIPKAPRKSKSICLMLSISRFTRSVTSRILRPRS